MFKKTKQKIQSNNEIGARKALIQELFQDFHSSRHQVYAMNFIRGVFFGFGSVLGGTVLIAILAWVLSWFVTIPGIGQTARQVEQSIQTQKK